MAAAKGLLVALVAGLWLVVAVGLGVMLLFSWAVGDVAPYRFELPGSTWRVQSVDGVVMAEPVPRLALDEGGQAATLTFGCGDVRLFWVWDSDGNATGFQERARPADCPATEMERAVLRRLTSTEGWRASGVQSIDVVDPEGGLLRLVLSRGSMIVVGDVPWTARSSLQPV